MDNVKITLIIPMYNESSIIADTAKTLSEYMQNNFDSYEILFSDDGSKDGSADIVRELDLPCVRVVGYEQNHGKGCAIRTGMLEAHGEIVMFTDADLAYGTDVIKEAYDKLSQADANMLIGSRNLSKDGYEGYTALRKLMSKIYIKVLCMVGGFAVGLILISRIFSKLLAWRKAGTFCFVIGLSFGSIASMFLNPDIVQVYFNWGHGSFSIAEFLLGLGLLTIGLVGSALLTKYGLIHESDENKKTDSKDNKTNNSSEKGETNNEN